MVAYLHLVQMHDTSVALCCARAMIAGIFLLQFAGMMIAGIFLLFFGDDCSDTLVLFAGMRIAVICLFLICLNDNGSDLLVWYCVYAWMFLLQNSKTTDSCPGVR